MGVGSAVAKRRLIDLVQVLSEDALASPRVLGHVADETMALLDADVSSCHRAIRTGTGMSFEFFEVRGGNRELAPAFNTMLRQMGAGYAVYDPNRPAPAQRNRVWRHRRSPKAFAIYSSAPVVQHEYPRLGLAGLDEMRVLICDGPVLLSWLGGLRQRHFDRDDERVLAAIAQPLGTWLRWRERLGARDADAETLPAALEAIDLAAFVMDRHGGIRHANAAGRARIERDRRALRSELATCARTGAGTAHFKVTAIRISGTPAHHLLCIERPAIGVDLRIDRAANAWRLTAREAEVLREIAVGLPNRMIATRLACAERTVEIHVSRILAKAGVEGRTALVWQMLNL